jgi:hypothetical protein
VDSDNLQLISKNSCIRELRHSQLRVFRGGEVKGTETINVSSKILYDKEEIDSVMSTLNLNCDVRQWESRLSGSHIELRGSSLDGTYTVMARLQLSLLHFTQLFPYYERKYGKVGWFDA